MTGISPKKVERYAVRRSGAEVLMREGESAADALRRDRAEQRATRAKERAERHPVVAADRPEENSTGLSRDWKIAIVALAVIVVGSLVLGIVPGVIAENKRVADAQLRAEQIAEENAKKQAAIDAAVADGKDALAAGKTFAAKCADYATHAQIDSLQHTLDNLANSLVLKQPDPITTWANRVRSKIKEIGPVGTPEQAETRAAEEAAAAQKKAEEDAAAAAAAAIKASEDQFIAASSAAGVDVTNRATVLESAKNYCSRLAAGGQSTAVLVSTVRSSPNPLAIAYFCPQYSTAADLASRAIGAGSFAVGSSISEGTYMTLNTGVKDCYWERSSGGGDIIDNDFISFAPDGVSVTIYNGEGFTTSGCGLWIRQ